MLSFLSANGAWGSCRHFGTNHDTERGNVVKCYINRNNTYFVVSTARGLKKYQRSVAAQAVACLCSRRTFVSAWFDKVNHLDGYLWLMSCSLTIHNVRKEGAKRKRMKRHKDRANEMGRRKRERLSLVQINERWKHKEAVQGWGDLNREDWQKQSSSTVGCLNLHRCCSTPSTPLQSPLMISNVTQSFVIALEPNQHCSLWLTLLSFNCLETYIHRRNFIQSQLGLGGGEGLSFWLKLTHWQQNVLSAITQLRRMSLPVYLQEVIMYCGVTWEIEWWHLPSLKHN